MASSRLARLGEGGGIGRHDGYLVAQALQTPDAPGDDLGAIPLVMIRRTEFLIRLSGGHHLVDDHEEAVG